MRQHVRSECLFATARVNAEPVADPEGPSSKEVTEHRYNVNRNRVHKNPSDRPLYYAGVRRSNHSGFVRPLQKNVMRQPIACWIYMEIDMVCTQARRQVASDVAGPWPSPQLRERWPVPHGPTRLGS